MVKRLQEPVLAYRRFSVERKHDTVIRDWIVRYCLEQKIYNINQVNTLLFEYDQEQLGA